MQISTLLQEFQPLYGLCDNDDDDDDDDDDDLQVTTDERNAPGPEHKNVPSISSTHFSPEQKSFYMQKPNNNEMC